MRDSQKIGKAFQRELEGIFSDMKKNYGFDWHPLVDTRVAGNTVAAQPSDYLMVGGNWGIACLEAKASEAHDHFIPSMLRPKQRQAIQHWGRMLGARYLVVFKSVKTGLITVHDGRDCLSPSPPALFTPCPPQTFPSNLAELMGLQPLHDVIDKYQRRYP